MTDDQRGNPTGTARGRLTGRHVLVIEDVDAVARITKIALERMGAKVTCAATLSEGVGVLAAHPETGLIVCDARLEDGSGTDWVYESQPSLCHALLTSGAPLERDIITFPEPARVGYLAKPYSLAELNAAIDRLFGAGHEYESI